MNSLIIEGYENNYVNLCYLVNKTKTGEIYSLIISKNPDSYIMNNKYKQKNENVWPSQVRY